MQDILEYPTKPTRSTKERNILTDSQSEGSHDKVAEPLASSLETTQGINTQVASSKRAWLQFGLTLTVLATWVSLAVVNNLFVAEASMSSIIIASVMFFRAINPVTVRR